MNLENKNLENRVRSLGDVDTIENRIKTASENLMQLKSTQPIGGDTMTSNVVLIENQPYDFYYYITNDNPIINQTLDFAYSGPGTEYAMLELNMFIRINNSNVMEAPEPKRTPTAPPVEISWRRYYPFTPGHAEWRFQLRKNLPGIYGFDVYIKIFITGTSGSTF